MLQQLTNLSGRNSDFWIDFSAVSMCESIHKNGIYHAHLMADGIWRTFQLCYSKNELPEEMENIISQINGISKEL